MSDNRFEQVVEEANKGPAQMKHYVVFILDRSSSMNAIREEAINSFNQQIEQTKTGLAEQDNITTEVSLVTFASNVDTPEHWCRPLVEIVPIPIEDYVPGGMTAMYDAVGFAITELQKQPDISDKNTSILMFIVSDGAENNSKKFKASHISSMVKEMQDTKRWTFVYEGANQDLAEVQDTVNIYAGNTMLYTADSAGVKNLSHSRKMASQGYYNTMARKVSTGGGAVATNNFYDGDSGHSSPSVTDQPNDNPDPTDPQGR